MMFFKVVCAPSTSPEMLTLINDHLKVATVREIVDSTSKMLPRFESHIKREINEFCYN